MNEHIPLTTIRKCLDNFEFESVFSMQFFFLHSHLIGVEYFGASARYIYLLQHTARNLASDARTTKRN